MATTCNRIEVPRSARYYTIGADNGGRSVWFVCHGYAQLAERFVREFEPIADEAMIVAPEALSRMYIRGSNGVVGASWMTHEDRLAEIADYVRYLDMVYSRTISEETGNVTVLGFSQGTATASRWLVSGRARADRLILAGGLLAPDAEAGLCAPASTALRDTSIVYAIGDTDALVDRGELARQREALAAAGHETRLVTFAGGHRIDAATLRTLQDDAKIR